MPRPFLFTRSLLIAVGKRPKLICGLIGSYMEWLAIVIPLAGMILFLLMGVKIFVALGFWAVIGYAMVTSWDLAFSRLALVGYHQICNYAYSPLILFILTGEIIVFSGIGSDLYEAMHKWFGQVPGGLAIASTVACALFAAISGMSVAGAVTIGLIAIPEMRQRGYSKPLATGAVIGSGTLAIMIPPSFDFIAYSIMARQSIGEMFIAGVVPGIIEGLIIIGIIMGWAKIHPKAAPRLAAVPWKQKLISLKAVLPVVGLLIFILGSIYTGIATPTEAAGVSVIVALIITAFYRKLTWRNLFTALIHTVTTSGFIFIILIVALFFGYYLTITGVTRMLTSAVMASGFHPKVIMLFIMLLLAMLGCVLDPGSMLFITTPILVPIVSALGFDLVWYGVVLVIAIEMGLITPPVGIQLYVIQGIVPDIPIGDIIRGSIPFMMENVVTLLLLLFFPQIALWLPRTMMH